MDHKMLRLIGAQASGQLSLLWLVLTYKKIEFEFVSSTLPEGRRPSLIYRGEKVTGFSSCLNWIERCWPVPALLQDPINSSDPLTLQERLKLCRSLWRVTNRQDITDLHKKLSELEQRKRPYHIDAFPILPDLITWLCLNQIDEKGPKELLMNFEHISSWYHQISGLTIFQQYQNWQKRPLSAKKDILEALPEVSSIMTCSS